MPQKNEARARRAASRVVPSLLLAILTCAALMRAGENPYTASPPAAVPPTGASHASASLSGVVLGPDGARLPGVTLVLRREGQEVMRGASGSSGVFRFPGIVPGRYEVAGSLAGFERTSVPLGDLGPGESRTLEVTMVLATLRESLTVLGSDSRDSLEASAIRERPATDVGEALSAMPGVFALRKGGIANDVVVRGLQRGDVNVLVDGQRVHGACPNRMDPAAFHVDFAEVERVDVARGPFDVRHQGSLGGVVNVVTRRPERGLSVSPSVSLGSFGHVNPALTASWGGDRASILVGLSYRDSGAYRDGTGAPFTDAAGYRADADLRDAYRVGTGWAQLGWRLSEGHRLQLGWTRQEARDVLYPYLMMDAAYDDTDRVNLIYEASGGPGPVSGFSAQVYHSRVDHWMTDELRTSGAAAPRGWSMGTRAATETSGGRVEARFEGGSVGVEAFRNRWDVETQVAGMQYRVQASIPDAVNDSLGAFAELSRRLGGSVSLVAGARLDHVWSAADGTKANTDLYFAYWGTRALRSSDTLPSGKLRLEWDAGEGVELAATVGRTTRVAEGNERYFALRRMGTDWVGNPELDPARSTGAELSAMWRRSGALLSASAFVTRVDGFITVVPRERVQPVPGVMNREARSWANVDATLLGAEANSVVPLLGRLFVSADVSWVRGRKDEGPGPSPGDTDLAEMPPLRGRLALRYDDGRFFGVLEAVLSADQERVDAALKEEPTPGWTVANLGVGYRRERLSLAAGVSNLFDRLYTEHLSYQRDPFRSGVRVPSPGRSVFVNMSARF